MSRRWRAELDTKMLALNQLREQLDGCIGCGCLSIHDCKLRNPLDTLSEQGSGARLLLLPRSVDTAQAE